MRGYVLGGIGVSFVTQSVNAFSSADRIGALGAGLLIKSHAPKAVVTAGVALLKPPCPPPWATPGK